MKAILVFNLPKEQDTYDVCVNSGTFFSALYDIDNLIRHKLKHGNHSEEINKILQEIRDLVPERIHDIG